MFGFFKKKQTSADGLDEKYAVFRKNNKGKSVQFAARSVCDFVTWQHNHVELRKMQKTKFVASPFATNIEKAFLFGAAAKALDAFSLSDNDLGLFFENVLGIYLGGEMRSMDSEMQDILTAKDKYENAAQIGGKLMTAYLIYGRQDEYSYQLSSLVEV